MFSHHSYFFSFWKLWKVSAIRTTSIHFNFYSEVSLYYILVRHIFSNLLICFFRLLSKLKFLLFFLFSVSFVIFHFLFFFFVSFSQLFSLFIGQKYFPLFIIFYSLLFSFVLSFLFSSLFMLIRTHICHHLRGDCFYTLVHKM